MRNGPRPAYEIRADQLEENQGRLLDPDQASGGGARPDLAMFDLAIDSELRGCDMVRLKDMTVDRAMVHETKTGHPIRSKLSEQ